MLIQFNPFWDVWLEAWPTDPGSISQLMCIKVK